MDENETTQGWTTTNDELNRQQKATMAIELDNPIVIALLVLLAVATVGLVIMKSQQSKAPAKRGPGRPRKTPTKAPVGSPPKPTRNIAKGSGSVKTPAGRRSARIARKSLEHND